VSGELARRYHDATNHTWESVRRGGRSLDYRSRPHPFKEYPLPAEPVPAELDRVLKLGAAVVRTRGFAYGTYHFRTFSSAGALYPVELYVATPGGFFHFHPLEHALRRLRAEDVRGVIADAAADHELARAAALLVLTGIFWRTAWKYGARGYRHVWWDAGTLLANLLWLAPDARLVTAFVDDGIDEVVGADGRREFAVALVALGEADLVAQSYKLPPIAQELPPFAGEETFPLVIDTHEATRLADAAAVRRHGRASGSELQTPAAAPERLEGALRRRVSVREFTPAPVPRDELASLSTTAMAPIRSDTPPLTRLAVIANAVDGLEQAAFDFDSDGGFRLVRPQATRALAHRLTLEQDLGRRAAAVAWLFADLEHVLAERGDRGYREAQLEAGIRAGRAQVDAFARGWGATASTFYDDEVREAFATTDEPMLCFAVGRRR
jgi:SagB-type dehydrogenase family enzyme